MLISHARTMSENTILVQPATMNGERQDENAQHQGWLYAEPFGLLPPSLHVCILLAGQSFALLISRDGVPCGTNLITAMRHGACNIASVSFLKAILRSSKRSSSRKICRRRKMAEWQSSREGSLKSSLAFPQNERASCEDCHSA
jgi:hypothetical protein